MTLPSGLLGPSLEYVVVDVFTDTPYAGNPLAVVLGADDLSGPQLQSLAREFHLSETAFPMRPSASGANGSADYRLRICTPEVELPFAGHPSVGAAWVLYARGLLAAGERVQECGAGLLPVLVSAESVTLTGGAPLWGGVADHAALADAVGLELADVVPPGAGIAGCGISFGYLAVRHEAVDAAEVDPAALAALGLEAGLCVAAWDGTAAYTRVFAGDLGVAEDPATGSAALGLGVWLAATGVLGAGTTAYEVHQGHAMGRPSLLRCSVDVDAGACVRAQVTGRVVPIAEGRIALPPV